MEYETKSAGTQIPVWSGPNVDKQTFHPHDSHPEEQKVHSFAQINVKCFPWERQERK